VGSEEYPHRKCDSVDPSVAKAEAPPVVDSVYPQSIDLVESEAISPA